MGMRVETNQKGSGNERVSKGHLPASTRALGVITGGDFISHPCRDIVWSRRMRHSRPVGITRLLRRNATRVQEV